jgi:signal transduction histidine kinase
LGTLAIEGTTDPALDEEQRCRLAHEMARHLSVALENVQLVDEILRQRRLLEDTFNSLPDLLLVTDRALRVVQVNDAFARKLQRPPDQIFERALADVTGSALADWVAAAEPASGSDGGLTGPGTALPGGSRTFDDLPLEGIFVATVTPLVSDGGDITGRVVVLRDVTVQSRIEADREALRARLSQSEKLAALGQFVAGVAHEMNNPLQGLLGHLELLMAHADAAGPIRAELRRIHREGERAARIVRNLLVFSGARRMMRRRLRIERVLARALASRRTALARARIDVVRHRGASVPAVAGDPLLLQQAFLNVLINAEHAIRERDAAGTIELTTRTDASRRVITTVRDTGAGITPANLSRIFDPFFTTRDAGKGAGLGLAVTHGIIQEHGGTIYAGNAPEGGAVFTIELPGVPEVADKA